MNFQIPPLIDNESFFLKDAVKEYAAHSTEIKIATGYFRVSGFNLIRDDLGKLRPPMITDGGVDSPVKIIMGPEVDIPTAGQLVEGYRSRMTEEISNLPPER